MSNKGIALSTHIPTQVL